MLRFRGYDWGLLLGESRFEVHLGHPGSKYPRPMWFLRMHYVATGPEWRRCRSVDRPRFLMEIGDFTVSPGDWRNLAEVNFWNIEESDEWPEDDGPNPGDFMTTFYSSFRRDREIEHADCEDACWRVVNADGPLFTIELRGIAESHGHGHSLGAPDLVSSLPGETGKSGAGTCKNEIYLLETIPFGQIIAKVPRNTRDPFTYAEDLARRTLKTPRADHMTINDYINNGSENIRDDLYVHLHAHGYHDT